MKEELTALEEPLKQGLILRIMSSQSNKRSASLEDPTQKEFEQLLYYHDAIILPFALRGVSGNFSSGQRGYTQTPCKIGSASGIDSCDWWLLDRNTLFARHIDNRFRFSAFSGIYTENEIEKEKGRGKGETLVLAYNQLKDSL